MKKKKSYHNLNLKHFSNFMNQQHFISLQLDGSNPQKKVSTKDCQDVDDFKEAIKNAFSPLLDSYNSAQLTLYQPNGETEIYPQTPIDQLKEVPWKPMIVKVNKLTIQMPAASSSKQKRYKGLSVESTCRKYFDALARALSLYYKFNWGEKDENDYPTFGDVLRTVKKGDWGYHYRNLNGQERTDEDGYQEVKSKSAKVPKLDKPLNELFDQEQWKKLREMNQKTNDRIHDANVPKTSGNKFFIILSHEDYDEETISFFKKVGVKGKLFSNESDLEVKDELEMSGSSGSESNSPT